MSICALNSGVMRSFVFFRRKPARCSIFRIGMRRRTTSNDSADAAGLLVDLMNAIMGAVPYTKLEDIAKHRSGRHSETLIQYSSLRHPLFFILLPCTEITRELLLHSWLVLLQRGCSSDGRGMHVYWGTILFTDVMRSVMMTPAPFSVHLE